MHGRGRGGFPSPYQKVRGRGTIPLGTVPTVQVMGSAPEGTPRTALQKSKKASDSLRIEYLRLLCLQTHPSLPNSPVSSLCLPRRRKERRGRCSSSCTRCGAARSSQTPRGWRSSSLQSDGARPAAREPLPSFCTAGIWNCRTVLEGTLQISPTPCHGQGPLSSAQAPPSPIQPGLAAPRSRYPQHLGIATSKSVPPTNLSVLGHFESP